MTAAARLRELVQAATPGPWHRWGDPLGNPLIRRADKTTVSMLSWDNAALIALAPELAAWAADAAEALERWKGHTKLLHEGRNETNDPDLHEELRELPAWVERMVDPLLARLDGLLPEGGE